MTKTELQSALAEATQTDKKTAGVFLDTLSAIAYKDTKKNGEFVVPGFGKLVKQKRKARIGIQSQDATEDQDSRQNGAEIPSREGGKGCGSRGKEVACSQRSYIFCSRSFFSMSGAFSIVVRSPPAGSPHLPIMTPILAKVTAIEKRGDQYQVIVQISPKYRGSFNTLAFGEIKPHSGSLKDGRLDLVYIKTPA